ncbi:type VII secretion target [Amycolatopsis sp. NPDC058340]|uniref:type VII secretion target n=1 Tax=Amycolatopsis sp. NPDC058340 TaxID=3346453 RepID=UPI003667A759
MGYEVDPAKLLEVSDELGTIGTGLRSVSGQVAHTVVARLDFGGDRYQGHGAAYLAANGELAGLAVKLVGDIDEISRLLRESAGVYGDTESDFASRLDALREGAG